MLMDIINIYILIIVETMETESSEPSHVMTKKKLTLSFEEYRTLSNMIITHMRSAEDDSMFFFSHVCFITDSLYYFLLFII